MPEDPVSVRRRGGVQPAVRRRGRRFIVGITIIVAVFVILWLTAPQWDGPLRPAENKPPAQQFVSLNLTDWDLLGGSGCWEDLFSTGGTTPVGGVFHASVYLRYPFGTTGPTCTAQSVQVITPGFALVNSSVPVRVGPGSNAWLFANVTVPNTPFDGFLTLSMTATSS